jgi:hypothetical protein
MEERLEAWFSRYVDPALDGRVQPVGGDGQLRRATVPPDPSAWRSDVPGWPPTATTQQSL